MKDLNNFRELEALVKQLDHVITFPEKIDNVLLHEDGYVGMNNFSRRYNLRDLATIIGYDKFNESLEVFKTLLNSELSKKIKELESEIETYNVIKEV
jgi:hypothetical protein